MKLSHNLLTFRRFLAFGVLELSIIALFLPSAGNVIAVGAWLCFVILLMTYLFDLAYHSVGKKAKQ